MAWSHPLGDQTQKTPTNQTWDVLFCGTNKMRPQVKPYCVQCKPCEWKPWTSYYINSRPPRLLWLLNPKLEGNSCLVRRCTKWFLSEITSLPTPFDHLRQTFGNVFQLGLSVVQKDVGSKKMTFCCFSTAFKKIWFMTIVCEIGTPFKKYQNFQSNSKISNRNADCRSRSTWLFAPIVDFTMVPSTPWVSQVSGKWSEQPNDIPICIHIGFNSTRRILLLLLQDSQALYDASEHLQTATSNKSLKNLGVARKKQINSRFTKNLPLSPTRHLWQVCHRLIIISGLPGLKLGCIMIQWRIYNLWLPLRYHSKKYFKHPLKPLACVPK